ncbi:uncharacterized protein PAN0_002d1082 [Moesziomyces antarcticus]|uniref:Uncharacterized protein n=1 Tax=Pseudozyma antarctica TaxID=84753 RepID=A0A5C3FHP3_PSEA2|nr:uncharacterized protein PAN0_002d1082 [Moesziomyces antarcticus]GAK62880.1 conserved hypothetical protein [Moesziomyces antarcticus]SPO43646.1 uncharacterized protein PSANT_01331 [Moesziomyces antarcticus]
MATLPQQAPGPGPTAQALPSYLSYSPIATSIFPYTSIITQVVYDPQGGFAPYQTLSTVQGVSTSIDYSVVNVPLLYTGPFPAPDLGTLYTTPGQILPTPTSAAPTQSNATETQNTGASASQTAAPSTNPNDTATAASTDQGTLTAESAPPASPTATDNTASSTPGATPSSGTSPTSALTNTSQNPSSTPGATTPPATNSSGTASSSTGSPTGTTSGEPSATAAGAPNPGVRAAKGLSGGQIAGIVLGAFFALLLLLLLLLCCLRRRRHRRQQQTVLAAATGGTGTAEKTGASGFGRGASVRGGARGNYAALGTAAGAAGAAGLGAAGAAAAGRRGSIGSDDWEEDHLTSGGAGSGFFVVGGKRLGPNRSASIASRRSRGSSAGLGPSYTTANAAPSSRDGARKGGMAALAAAGAGVLGAAFGRGKKNKPRVELEEEQPLSDEDADGSMAERRGLMPFHDSPGSGYGSGQEMREAGRHGSGATAALLGAAAGAGGAAFKADRRHRSGSGPETASPPRAYGGASMSRPASSAFSGASSGGQASSHATGGTTSSQTQRAGGAAMSSSNSTGGFTTSGSGASLPPPPRAPRGSPQAVASYANLEPSSAPAPSLAHDARYSVDTADSNASARGGLNAALLGLGGAGALGGLGALAAGHRDSSTLSPDMRASHASEMSADELRHLRSTDPERYSRFISTGSNLLGPDYQPSPDIDSEDKQLGGSDALAAATLGQRTRLPTIRSVGEFGEKSDSGSQRGTGTGTGERTGSSQPLSSLHAVGANSGSLGGGSTGSRNVVSPLPVYEPQQRASETLPHYTLHNQSTQQGHLGEPEQIQSPISEGPGRFVTPPDSPRNTLGGAMSVRSGGRPSSDAQRYADAEDSDLGERGVPGDEDGRAELAGAGIASTGIMGGVAAGWRRLTMGQYAWIPGTTTARGTQAGSLRDSSGELNDAEGRYSYEHNARPSEDSSRLQHQRRASRLEPSDMGLSDVRSEHASVYGPSALGHATSTSSPVAHLSSKEASGSSGEQAKGSGEVAGAAALSAGLGAVAARQRSYPSVSSRGGGYAASQSNSSVSRRTGSDSTGLDSLSAVAQLSSRSTGSASTRSGFRSSSRGGRSGGMSEVSMGSGASTGAASYSPSGMLSRGNTTSTRDMRDASAPTASATYYASRPSGDAESLMTEATDARYADADVASSMATQGGASSLERRKRPRSSSVDGLSRLDSLREVREASDPFSDAERVADTQQGGHYPSASLGAAVSRSVARDLRQERSSPGEVTDSSFLQPQPLPQRSRIRSLQPGTAAPAPTALAPSLSTPSLNSGEQAELAASESDKTMPSLGSTNLSAVPASASWRPSPRVASASQRAAEAQAALLRAQASEASAFGGPTPPRSQAASPSGADARARGASYNWADLDTTFRRQDPADTSADVENSAGDGPNDTDADRSNRSFDWPKFLRF